MGQDFQASLVPTGDAYFFKVNFRAGPWPAFVFAAGWNIRTERKKLMRTIILFLALLMAAGWFAGCCPIACEIQKDQPAVATPAKAKTPTP